jgi:hypothetical protein
MIHRIDLRFASAASAERNRADEIECLDIGGVVLDTRKVSAEIKEGEAVAGDGERRSRRNVFKSDAVPVPIRKVVVRRRGAVAEEQVALVVSVRRGKFESQLLAVLQLLSAPSPVQPVPFTVSA